MATKRAAPPGAGGFFSLFDLSPAVFEEASLSALGATMARAQRQNAIRMGSGYVYLGQFIAHDISKLQRPDGPVTVPAMRQLRTPTLDLDSVYGKGFDDKESAVNEASGEMQIGEVHGSSPGLPGNGDLPRDKETRKARIPEVRNDENLIVAQLHVQFLKLHNLFVAELRRTGSRSSAQELFDAARTQVVLHYQQVVLYDFLDTILERRVWEYVIGGNTGTLWNPPASEMPRMPIEFSAAAFRFGHSMVRPDYQLNRDQGVDLAGLFKMTGDGGFGGKPCLPASHLVDWRFFFHSTAGETPLNEALHIDPAVHVRLADGPLATKNLLIGNQSGLPDGQALVRHVQRAHPALASVVHLRELSQDELNPMLTFRHGATFKSRRVFEELDSPSAAAHFLRSTPLWYYLLAEAQAMHGGSRLGTLGSLLVAEVLRALVWLSSPSILREPLRLPYLRPPHLRPTKDLHGQRYFRMIDLLNAVASKEAGAAKL
ncbi:hypothetical protein HNQ60_002663 [Povalibacter uvarum]|uniref:Heme peroxidase n=1 Tax=Povalibacter uvarum TaxID=732238 RepID=A0A841HNZ0_9GAMM|nr:peroxidase family protein [Povalibacter uvarum]MBB6093782.1 hypothetical protein [Povalibacter uvarum]